MRIFFMMLEDASIMALILIVLWIAIALMTKKSNSKITMWPGPPKRSTLPNWGFHKGIFQKSDKKSN